MSVTPMVAIACARCRFPMDSIYVAADAAPAGLEFQRLDLVCKSCCFWSNRSTAIGDGARVERVLPLLPTPESTDAVAVVYLFRRLVEHLRRTQEDTGPYETMLRDIDQLIARLEAGGV